MNIGIVGAEHTKLVIQTVGVLIAATGVVIGLLWSYTGGSLWIALGVIIVPILAAVALGELRNSKP